MLGRRSPLCLLLLFAISFLSLLPICRAHESASAALFHDRSPLLEVEELTQVSSAVMDEKTRWGLSDNMAHYLGLRRFLSFSLPVHVNIIFVGFHGDGNGFLTLNQGDYAAWFEHLEHELEHVVAPVGETQTTTDENETPDSSVTYRFLVDVLHLSPLVNTIVEDTIVWGLADEEPPEADEQHADGNHKDVRGEFHYVDAMRMSSLLKDLLLHLNLTNSYTFFVLNPKTPVSHDEVYGYRYGFSDEDIEVLQEHAKEIRIEWPPAPGAARVSNHTSDVISKLQFRDLFAESEQWANEYITQFRDATEPVDCSLPQWAEHIRCRARRGGGRSVLERADYISHYGTLEEKLYLQHVLSGGPVNEQCLVDVWLSRDRFTFLDLTAGPFSWGPNVAGEGVRTEESLPRVPVSTPGETQLVYNGAKADNTELGEAVANYKAHCSMLHPDNNPNDKPSAYCNDLQTRILRLEAQDAAKDKESWASQLAGSEDEGSVDPLDAIEQVMWRLSATLANGVRALLAPPSGLYSTPLTLRVSFQAILVRSAGVMYKPEELLKWGVFKDQVESLRLPGQDFSFTFSEQELALTSELSMAFRMSLRTHVIPTLNTGGSFKATQQTFVDSLIFRELLGPRNLYTSANVPIATNATGDLRYRTTLVQRTIPIYIFAVGTEFGPMLVDRYYQAKALSDMVVAVMSDFNEYESRLSCNAEPIYWDLTDPVKALLSATSLALGGLVPLHVGYNHPRHRTTQDWLWSVGDSPLSHTSSGMRFNQLQRDLIHRNYVRQHVDAALEQMDEAINWLAEEATEDSDYDSIAPSLTIYWSELRELYGLITRLLGDIGHEVAHLDFPMAAPLLPRLESTVASFHALASHVSGMSHLLRCSARTVAATEKVSRSINWGVIAALVLLDSSVVAMALFALSRKRKVKIN